MNVFIYCVVQTAYTLINRSSSLSKTRRICKHGGRTMAKVIGRELGWVPPVGGVKHGGVGETSYFRAKCVNVSKTVLRYVQSYR